MKIKYELNDLVVIKRNGNEARTIRIFEILTYPLLTVKAIDDDTHSVFVLENIHSSQNGVIWKDSKDRYLKAQSAINAGYREIELIKNTFSIDVHKKSFYNLRSGFDFNILKFEEIKLFSLNLHIPLGTPHLTSEKIVFLINKFIWDLEKLIPVDVYYQNLDCGEIDSEVYSFIKIAVFAPNYLVKKVNGNINYHTFISKITLLDLIKDIWVNALIVYGAMGSNKDNYISDYNYYATTIGCTHPIDNLTKIITDITFNFASKKYISEILAPKLLYIIENETKPKIDLIHFNIVFDQDKGDIHSLLNILNNMLKANLTAVKKDNIENGFEITGTVRGHESQSNEERANYYANYLFELRDNLKGDEDPLSFDMFEIIVAVNCLNFVPSKKPALNKIKIDTTINNFISYLYNKNLIDIGYNNKLLAYKYHG